MVEIRRKSRPVNVAMEAILGEIGQKKKKPGRKTMCFAPEAKDQRLPVPVVWAITLGRVMH